MIATLKTRHLSDRPGVALIAGVSRRLVAALSGAPLLALALGMAIGTGVKTALDASVFAAAAGAFMLALDRES